MSWCWRAVDKLLNKLNLLKILTTQSLLRTLFANVLVVVVAANGGAAAGAGMHVGCHSK